MTTAEFIYKTYGTTNSRWGRHGYERWCSSVLTDKDGNAYSYGYHYPLLFKVEGLDILNVTGYSNTTAKHISWAWRAVSNPVEVELRGARLPLTLKDIQVKLGSQLADLKHQMDSKKRKDTQVYKQLEWQYARVAANYNRVQNRVTA